VLVDRVRPALAHAVGPLQVAARLEAEGVTDRGARVEYGFDDVFALADAVHARLRPVPGPRPAPPPPVGSARRDAAHGALYLMPTALFPAVLAAVGQVPLVTVLVLAGGLGWVWSGGASWLAYRRLGGGDPAGAAAALRGSVVLGLPAAAVLGAALAALGVAPGVGVGVLVALCAAQMAYQLASTLLVFYRREGLLAAALAPAVVAGAWYVVVAWPPGSPPAGGVLPVALALAAAAVLAALGLGLREAARAGADPDRPTGGRAGPLAGLRAGLVGLRAGLVGLRAGLVGLRAGLVGLRAGLVGLRADLRGLAWAGGYAGLSAAYLLGAQAPYLRDRLDVALTAVPLLAGMGVVEWRARRFFDRARATLSRVRYPREFTGRVRRMLAGGVAGCTAVVAGLAVPLLLGLSGAGLLSPAGVLMAGAHAVLAGAYFLSYLLAGLGRYGALCAALLAAVAAQAVGGRLLGAGGAAGGPTGPSGPAGGAGLDPVLDTGLFLGSAVLLVGLWAALLAHAARDAWRFR
jgi:hypothetical protein